ncbi:MAG TPA: amidohydrolase [Ktedonobacterales bacterium]
MDVKHEVAERHSTLVALRRDFHQHPELAMQETRTAGIIAERLRASGLEVRAGVANTGVVGVLRGGHPGKTLAIRADIDALPVQEENSLPFKSEIPGKMHACGHDGHAAIALTVADILAQHRSDLHGNLTFLFQPAEEVLGGAKPMLDEGTLQQPDVDAVIGLHLASGLPTSLVGVRPGVIAASSDGFSIRVRGRAGHGAMPHQAIDPILSAAQIVVALQTLITREISPLHAAVLTLGSFHSGSAANVIADEAVLQGTIRAFSVEDRAHLVSRLSEVVQQVAASLGASATVEMVSGCPPCVNEEAMTQLVQRAAVEAVGEGQVIAEGNPSSASDDMSYFLNAVPGCYFNLGAGDEAHGYGAPHHSPRFTVDEACLPTGVEVMVRAALEYLR